jgi:hypothetical protein
MITEDEGIKPKRPKVKTKAWVSGKGKRNEYYIKFKCGRSCREEC